MIGIDAGFQRRSCRLAFKKIRVESFERVEPVMITRNCVDRFRKPLKRKIEIWFAIMHRTRRIDNIRRYDEEFHPSRNPSFR
jgi:hypothetical protein